MTQAARRGLWAGGSQRRIFPIAIVALVGLGVSVEFFRIVVSSGELAYGEDAVLHWSLLALGIVLTTGLVRYLVATLNRTEVTCREVEERTAALMAANESLSQSEERHRRLFELSPDAMIVHCNGPIILANPAAVRLFRAATEADLVGKDFDGLVHPRSFEEIQCRRAGPFDAGAMHEFWRARHVALDGAQIETEIRTPLNGVLCMTGLLLDTRLDLVQRKYAETVRESGEALLTLLNDILDLAKLEVGRIEFELADFNLAHLVEGVVEL